MDHRVHGPDHRQVDSVGVFDQLKQSFLSQPMRGFYELTCCCGNLIVPKLNHPDLVSQRVWVICLVLLHALKVTEFPCYFDLDVLQLLIFKLIFRMRSVGVL